MKQRTLLLRRACVAMPLLLLTLITLSAAHPPPPPPKHSAPPNLPLVPSRPPLPARIAQHHSAPAGGGGKKITTPLHPNGRRPPPPPVARKPPPPPSPPAVPIAESSTAGVDASIIAPLPTPPFDEDYPPADGTPVTPPPPPPAPVPVPVPASSSDVPPPPPTDDDGTSTIPADPTDDSEPFLPPSPHNGGESSPASTPATQPAGGGAAGAGAGADSNYSILNQWFFIAGVVVGVLIMILVGAYVFKRSIPPPTERVVERLRVNYVTGTRVQQPAAPGAGGFPLRNKHSASAPNIHSLLAPEQRALLLGLTAGRSGAATSRARDHHSFDYRAGTNAAGGGGDEGLHSVLISSYGSTTVNPHNPLHHANTVSSELSPTTTDEPTQHTQMSGVMSSSPSRVGGGGGAAMQRSPNAAGAALSFDRANSAGSGSSRLSTPHPLPALAATSNSRSPRKQPPAAAVASGPVLRPSSSSLRRSSVPNLGPPQTVDAGVGGDSDDADGDSAASSSGDTDSTPLLFQSRGTSNSASQTGAPAAVDSSLSVSVTSALPSVTASRRTFSTAPNSASKPHSGSLRHHHSGGSDGMRRSNSEGSFVAQQQRAASAASAAATALSFSQLLNASTSTADSSAPSAAATSAATNYSALEMIIESPSGSSGSGSPHGSGGGSGTGSARGASGGSSPHGSQGSSGSGPRRSSSSRNVRRSRGTGGGVDGSTSSSRVSTHSAAAPTLIAHPIYHPLENAPPTVEAAAVSFASALAAAMDPKTSL